MLSVWKDLLIEKPGDKVVQCPFVRSSCPVAALFFESLTARVVFSALTWKCTLTLVSCTARNRDVVKSLALPARMTFAVENPQATTWCVGEALHCSSIG